MRFCVVMMGAMNIYQTFEPFYYVLKIFGFTPYSFKGPISHGKLETRPYNYAYMALWFCSLIILLTLNIWVEDNEYSDYIILVKGWRLGLIGYIFSAIICFVYRLIKREYLVQFLDLLNEFDHKTKFFHTAMDLRAHKMFAFKVLVFSFSLNTFLTIVTDIGFVLYDKINPDHFMIFSYWFSELFIAINFYHLTFAALAVKARFAYLNESMRWISFQVFKGNFVNFDLNFLESISWTSRSALTWSWYPLTQTRVQPLTKWKLPSTNCVMASI